MPHPLQRLGRTLTLSALLLAPLGARSPLWAQASRGAAGARASAQAQPDPLFTRATAMYDTALQGHVSKEGLVDYVKLKGDANLEAFVAALPLVDVSKFPVFPVKSDDKDKDKEAPGRKPAKAEAQLDRSWELSFWINAHNALLARTLSEAYPIGSPDDVKGLGTRKFAVAGGQYTLDELRQKAASLDRRAPFAMIDGTMSGPKMPPRAVRAYSLSDTLDSAISALVDDGSLVELQRIQNVVAVAPFFSTVDALWKPRTAQRKWDGIRALLSAYTTTRANRNYFTTNRYEVVFVQPDRKLNRVPSDFAGIS